MVLENELLYGEAFPVSAEVRDKNFLIPIGKAKIEHEGKDITITAFSRGVGTALAARKILAEQHGVEAEVINLRSIRPLDRLTIIDSVKKTTRLLTVEEGWPQSGVGAEIAAVIMESDAWGFLDAPITRVTGADIPMPYSLSLEKAALPSADNVVDAVLRTLGKKRGD